MLSPKSFISSETNQVLMKASSAQSLLSLDSTGLLKVSFWGLLWRRLFRVSTKRGYDHEFLRLQAHLLDLLELNIELFDKRCQEYERKKESMAALQSSQAQTKIDKFLEEDLALYRHRKSILVEKSFGRIVNTKDKIELLEIKDYLISNVALVSYKTKQPYYFSK